MNSAPARTAMLRRTPMQQRRAAAGAIAALVSFALGAAAMTAATTSNELASFVLFALSLPWTISIYVLTMFFNVTSPVAVGITFVLITLLAWRYVSRLLVRTVC